MTTGNQAAVRYLIFDVESVADAQLVARLRYPGQGLTPEEALRKYRSELMAKFESDFVPYTFHLPVAISVAKITADYRLLDIVALDEPQLRSHVITSHFWKGWEAYRRPTLVSFNGRSFDLPLLELAAYRYGISLPGWFQMSGRSYEQPRNRYNTEAHLDLYDLFTNFGASRFNGGLNLAAQILGKPGKMDVQGFMVQDMWDSGQRLEISNYCRCDVLDTYFVFLRSRVLVGAINLDREQDLVAQAHQWLQDRADATPAFRHYLDRWGDWQNPWSADAPAPAATPESAAAADLLPEPVPEAQS